jgi:alpha-glucosidase (family GH31 glycosyl hydrolase)
VDSLNNWVYLRFSPRSVSFSGWVGDQDPTFAGLKDALNNMLRSAWAGCVSFGSDTGGYRCCGSSDPRGRTRELLLRWAQLNALMGLFENGG